MHSLLLRLFALIHARSGFLYTEILLYLLTRNLSPSCLQSLLLLLLIYVLHFPPLLISISSNFSVVSVPFHALLSRSESINNITIFVKIDKKYNNTDDIS
ncbi:hypothetical protein Hanom_Chr04g00325751 [Helianthus anomalus]